LSNVKDNARRMTIETVLVDNMEYLSALNAVRRVSVPINGAVIRERSREVSSMTGSTPRAYRDVSVSPEV